MKKTYKNLVHIMPRGIKDKTRQVIHTKQGKSRVVHNQLVKDSIEKKTFPIHRKQEKNLFFSSEESFRKNI